MNFMARRDNDGTVNDRVAGKGAADPGVTSRRQFLAGLAAVGAAACSRGGESAGGAPQAGAPLAPPPITDGRRIDVHHHFGPPAWVKALDEAGVLNNVWKDWHPSRAVEAMDRGGVATSISSITVPGIYFAEGIGNGGGIRSGVRINNDVRALARECNEFGARMVSDYPGRFGIFAALPLPDLDGSLREIEYVFDKLKLDGIGLICSIGNRLPGDPAFAPVFEELNRRRAVIYTHPQAPACCRGLIEGVGPTTIEYSTDTARAIVSWIESGSAQRFPDIRWIFSHGGGTLWSARYINGQIGTRRQAFESSIKPNSPMDFVRRYYYDTTASANFVQMQTLKTLVGASHIVFGTDNPYGGGLDGPLSYAQELRELAEEGVFTAEELRLINRENMVGLLPRYAT
jgi:predicted TIM-barrel fold metal-dependent hydrolase